MAAAGHDDDASACCPVRGREEYFDRRIVDVTNPIIFGDFRLLPPGLRAWRPVGPERQPLGGFDCVKSGRAQPNEDDERRNDFERTNHVASQRIILDCT